MPKGIHELQPSNYDKVTTLFAPMRFQSFCTIVLAGLNPGRVFVDDMQHPQTALVTRDDAWCFLVGKPDNTAFNRALNHALFEHTVVGKDISTLIFTCDSDVWESHIETVFAPRPPIPMPRQHYVCHELAFNWQDNVSEGFSIQRMDDMLLAQPKLQVPDDIKQTLDKWRALAQPQFQDFGFVAIHNEGETPAVVSWATVDAVVDGAGDIGLFTKADYRQRGLAAATTGAAIAYGLEHGLTELHWTTTESNIGSQRTAQKLGFERKHDYMSYYLCFDEAHHLGMMAYSHLEAARYEQAVDWFEKALTLGADLPAYAYYDAARAWAGLGHMQKAFRHLHLAIDKGWTYLAPVENCSEFAELRDMEEWAKVLTHIEKTGGNQ